MNTEWILIKDTNEAFLKWVTPELNTAINTYYPLYQKYYRNAVGNLDAMRRGRTTIVPKGTADNQTDTDVLRISNFIDRNRNAGTCGDLLVRFLDDIWPLISQYRENLSIKTGTDSGHFSEESATHMWAVLEINGETQILDPVYGIFGPNHAYLSVTSNDILRNNDPDKIKFRPSQNIEILDIGEEPSHTISFGLTSDGKFAVSFYYKRFDPQNIKMWGYDSQSTMNTLAVVCLSDKEDNHIQLVMNPNDSYKMIPISGNLYLNDSEISTPELQKIALYSQRLYNKATNI